MTHLLETTKSLLQDVLDHPADDVPRLIFADFLQDHAPRPCDRQRGEYIQASIAAYRVHNTPYACGQPACICAALFENSASLLREEWNWCRTLHGELPAWRELPRQYSRGFYEAVRCSIAQWLNVCGDLFQVEPVTVLEVSDPPSSDELRWLVSSQYSRRLRKIHLGPPLYPSPSLLAYFDTHLPGVSLTFTMSHE